MRPATSLADLTEKAWDTQLFASKTGLATTLGWKLVYHTLRSKGSRSGFPDRVLVRDRVIFAELKREDGKPTDTQIEWLTGLAKAGAEVYLWRPSDLEEIGVVLGGRWKLDGHLYDGRGQGLMPKSLWLPSGHRYDAHVQTELTAA